MTCTGTREWGWDGALVHLPLGRGRLLAPDAAPHEHGNATGRRRLGSPLRRLILDDDHRIPDLDLGVGDRAAGAGEAHALGRPKHLGVEREGLDAALHD
jgi:hypothetical protein